MPELALERRRSAREGVVGEPLALLLALLLAEEAEPADSWNDYR